MSIFFLNFFTAFQKVLWGKGYRELCDLLLEHCKVNGFESITKGVNGKKTEVSWMDIYGSGFDEIEVMEFAKK